jgi:hypothetical protein
VIFRTRKICLRAVTPHGGPTSDCQKIETLITSSKSPNFSCWSDVASQMLLSDTAAIETSMTTSTFSPVCVSDVHQSKLSRPVSLNAAPTAIRHGFVSKRRQWLRSRFPPLCKVTLESTQRRGIIICIIGYRS